MQATTDRVFTGRQCRQAALSRPLRFLLCTYSDVHILLSIVS